MGPLRRLRTPPPLTETPPSSPPRTPPNLSPEGARPPNAESTASRARDIVSCSISVDSLLTNWLTTSRISKDERFGLAIISPWSWARRLLAKFWRRNRHCDDLRCVLSRGAINHSRIRLRTSCPESVEAALD